MMDKTEKIAKLIEEMEKRNITMETIENYIKFEDECVKKGFSFESLLKARDRDTAVELTKINISEGSFPYRGLCPKCASGVLQAENYCSSCGQRIKR